MHAELQSMLQHRLAVISDHALRDRDPAAHLDGLKTASEEISAYTQGYLAEFDGKLRHYLLNCSYQKALDHLNPASSRATSPPPAELPVLREPRA